MLIPFGLKDNVIYHINDVPNGRSCNCLCPSCNKPLVAKNRGEYKRHHFAHLIETDCVNYQAMTYLHQYAQQVIELEKRIIIPKFTYSPEVILIDGSVLVGQLIHFNESEVYFDTIENEYLWNKYRIDSLGLLKQRSLFIEITVTHKNDINKIIAIKKSNKPAIEIVLTSLHNSDRLYSDIEIKKAIFDSSNINWICHPKAMEKVEIALSQLRIEAENKNRLIQIKLEKYKQKEMLEKKQEEERLRNIVLAKQRYRNEIKDELIWLSTITESWIENYEIEKQSISPSFLKWVEIDKYQAFIGVEYQNDWIFECCREHWQALIIDFLYRIGGGVNIQVYDINRYINNHIKQNIHMARLNIAQYQAKKKAAANGSQSKSRFAWYLSREENNKIISPFVVVFKYLQYLVNQDILSNNNLVFQIKDKDIDSFKKRIIQQKKITIMVNKKLEQEKKERESQELLEKYQAQQLLARRKTISIEKREKRIEELIIFDTVIFDSCGGIGYRCCNCHFNLPKKTISTEFFCPICGVISEFTSEIITQDYLDTAKDRYRCNNKPLDSLISYPNE